jgi:DNA-binding transcriptional LysR family regulator
VEAAAALEAGVNALRVERDSRLIAASMTVAEYLLPAWLAALRVAGLAATVALSAVNSAEVAQAVLAGDADIGFVEGPAIPDGQHAETVEAGSGTRRFLEEALRAQAGLEPVPPQAELSSTTAIKAAVAAGAGPAVLSSLAVAAELAAGTLRAVPVTGVDLNRTLRAVWSSGRRLTGPARDLYAIAAAGRRRPVTANVSGPRELRAPGRP